MPATKTKAASISMIEAAFSLCYKNACQLEGSDHGGRDSAAELALAGTIDVEVGRLLQPADFGASPIRREELYTPKKFRQRIFGPAILRRSLTLLSAIPILPFPQSATAR